MESLTSGWRHFRLLADYAAVSPWLTQAFARSHVVEFPFAIGNSATQSTKYSPQNRGYREVLRKYCEHPPDSALQNVTLILQA